MNKKKSVYLTKIDAFLGLASVLRVQIYVNQVYLKGAYSGRTRLIMLSDKGMQFKIIPRPEAIVLF